LSHSRTAQENHGERSILASRLEAKHALEQSAGSIFASNTGENAFHAGSCAFGGCIYFRAEAAAQAGIEIGFHRGGRRLMERLA
jgi:hypothetical protein